MTDFRCRVLQYPDLTRRMTERQTTDYHCPLATISNQANMKLDFFHLHYRPEEYPDVSYPIEFLA